MILTFLGIPVADMIINKYLKCIFTSVCVLIVKVLKSAGSFTELTEL